MNPWKTIACLAVLYFASASLACAADPPRGALARGMDLFLRDWSPDDPRSRGDGLGPLHNDTSCLKCHFLRSPGGAGRLEHNVQLISAIPNLDDGPEAEKRARNTLVTLHPAFAVGQGEEREVRRSIVLHRRDINPGYSQFRETLLGRSPGNLPILEQGLVESNLRVLVNANQIAWIVSERNSPAMFGNGLIDQLPDSAFIESAARQTGQDNVNGRVPRAMDGQIGRFGWRAQFPSIQSVVGNAFAVELGLSNPQVSQDPSPLAPLPQGEIPHDIDQRDINDVTKFISALPAPKLEIRGDNNHRRRVLEGRATFASIGCAICHTQHLSSIRNIYSDLLVHDMGVGLADPVPGATGVSLVARSNNALPPSAPSAGATGYGGAPVEVLAPIDPLTLRLWRTPPLWGVGDSAPYLHDGRAGTLRRAIILHGGEGERSRNRFLGLNESGQDDLVAFLSSLRAPQLIRPDEN